MKKISKKIAMFLFLLVIVCSFTNCLSWFLITGEPLELGSGGGPELLLLPFVDVLCLPVALVVFFVRLGIESARDNRGRKYDSIDTFSASVSYLSDAELDSLMLTFDTLPEAELASFMERLASLPEAELASFTETVNSFSEEELAAIIAAFNNFSEEEIASSLETLNSMPEGSLIAALDSVQQIEFQYKN